MNRRLARPLAKEIVGLTLVAMVASIELLGTAVTRLMRLY